MTRKTKPSDKNVPIGDLKRRVAKFSKDRDWEQFHAPKNLSMAIAAEAGELMEHFLWDDAIASRALSREKKGKVAAELADIFLFALQFANVAKIDVTKAALEKLAVNSEKYPVSKARGRSQKYTEL